MAAKKGSRGKTAKGQATPPKVKNATAKKDDAKKGSSPALELYNLNRRIAAQSEMYASLEARQRTAELARRAVFVCLMEMTAGNIMLAKQGNYSAAKFLLEFAGIYDLPPLSEASLEQPAAVAPNAGKPGKTSEELVLSFYKRLGMKVPVLAPEEGEQSSG